MDTLLVEPRLFKLLVKTRDSGKGRQREKTASYWKRGNDNPCEIEYLSNSYQGKDPSEFISLFFCPHKVLYMNFPRQKPSTSLAIKSSPHSYVFSWIILIYLLKGLIFSLGNVSLYIHFIYVIMVVISVVYLTIFLEFPNMQGIF